MITSTAASHPFSLCGLVLLLAILLQSVFVAVTYIYFTNELKQLRETYARSNIACLTGEDVGDLFRPSAFEDGYEKNDPCWEIKSHLHILIRKIVLKNYKFENAAKAKVTPQFAVYQKEDYPTGVIAAHVTGDSRKALPPENTFLKNYNGEKIQGWKSHRSPSFLSNVEMENGELIIRKSGFYYIYSQTYFRQRFNRGTEEKKGKQLVQQIYKVTSYPEPLLLMKNAKTTCWSKEADYGLHSIYQGGVFKLNENDRIFVTVSDINMIDMDENATFLGAFLVV
ncbi:hypothetical protein XENTR_v10014506 [Xenopus tropicalis]|uniref:Tumor necrosis factor ligand superfamily member 10 n=1 Tax=Xenopus tropicalis TaxID=8364 RepID=A0A6I8PXA6_XENTR|nr:TNF superfamily member 10 [Xenopus tropicalis]KAE8603928.1 hypothetical protein XENTR_v10014506 [Xenopus tropicalis]|eukprot:XP_002931598.2 PREDICTED: tumor necrosis factor ligand superfamily member 10 [Xenopus tropicalis]